MCTIVLWTKFVVDLQKQIAHGKSKFPHGKTNCSLQKEIHSRQKQINSECDIFMAEVSSPALIEVLLLFTVGHLFKV